MARRLGEIVERQRPYLKVVAQGSFGNSDVARSILQIDSQMHTSLASHHFDHGS